MKKVYLETFGCQMNVSDTERVATQLESNNYEIVPNEEAADIVLINTCSVREKAEHKLYTRVGQVRNSGGKKPIIGVLGCVAQLEGETLFKKTQGVDFVLGTQAVGRVTSIIERVLEGQKQISDLGVREENYDWNTLETQRHSPFVAFVPIIEGCNKFCTYCIVPFSRGREKSLPADVVIRQVKNLRNEGVQEVHLIGQNVNSYRPQTVSGLEGFTGATPFSKLLRAVAATGIPRIKFNTSFPRDFHPDIVDAINENENLCNWVHLPVQSGSDRILKAMRRGHTIENYLQRVDKIKSSKRKISLTTDIIVGFPDETQEDFADTVKLVEYCEYDSAYIFKYSPRFGTPAAEMQDTLTDVEKTNRFIALENVQKRNQTKSLKSFENSTVKVLAERKSNKPADNFFGHTTCHKIVNFVSSKDVLGKIVDVKITEAKSNTLFGIIC
ncbi:MAG: (Dimethylallyl)adenosine tRNA methylthiotransferase MiaB [Acidobacteria bacterium]|jgi:tRNA-2-methylthio-N6-dimethylallyladenosine synthase|nr:(Dimethylallyl)adenosine tRNA methylthiotransferase MiaB [Acidobacteriota bacterium]